jgi:hypothetical protein
MIAAGRISATSNGQGTAMSHRSTPPVGKVTGFMLHCNIARSARPRPVFARPPKTCHIVAGHMTGDVVMDYMLMPLERYADFSGRLRRKE